MWTLLRPIQDIIFGCVISDKPLMLSDLQDNAWIPSNFPVIFIYYNAPLFAKIPIRYYITKITFYVRWHFLFTEMEGIQSEPYDFSSNEYICYLVIKRAHCKYKSVIAIQGHVAPIPTQILHALRKLHARIISGKAWMNIYIFKNNWHKQ